MKVFKTLLKPILISLCILVIVGNVISVLSSQKGKYLSSDYWERFQQLERVYLGSQYVNKNPVGWIPDDTVFAYAGGAYIKGINPILVIPDAPPLGKYLIGISILLFNNEHLLGAIFGIFALFFLYLLSLQILKDKLLALLPSVFLSFEPMFKNQFIYTPLLDVYQLVFILLYFYCINKAFLGKKHIILFFIFASVLLGLFMSTKFFVSGLTILAAAFVWTILHKDKKKFIGVLFTAPLAFIVLLASYARVFAFGYDLHQFLGIQKWVFLYHKSQIIFPLSAWDLLLFNRWHVWFGDKPIISDSQWFITWPLITILSVVTALFYVCKKIKKRNEIEIIMLWAVFYMLFLSFGQIFSRYFIIFLPALYIISVYGISALINQYVLKSKTIKGNNTRQK